MTREERLQLLKQIEKDIHVCSLERTLTDDMKSCAIHSAIEELEKEACEDAISREAAKEAVETTIAKYIPIFIGRYERIPLEVAMTIKNLPPVKPTNKEWISVKERLPKADGEYLLFGRIDECEEYYKFIGTFDELAEKFGIWEECFESNTLGDIGSKFYEYDEVLAWMPLPDDYTEGTK